jgi:hypothetical protein
MAPGLMHLLRGILGSGNRAPDDAAAEAATEYKGFAIRPAPRREGSGWLTAGIISKQFPDGPKEHRFVRADTYANRDDAIAFCVTKAKQIIDEQGERLFGSDPPR